MAFKKTQEQVLSEFREKHGDLYDYSKVVYTGTFVKVKIICKKHGIFHQAPRHHRSGAGCIKCAKESLLSNTEEFILDATKIHGQKYNYSRVVYVNSTTKVDIICSKHGMFSQIPNSHKNGKGCHKCSKSALSNTEEFIIAAKKVHGDRYGYSSVNYIKNKMDVDIICHKHGIFSQRVSHHKEGAGCPQCSLEGRTLTTDQVIEQFKKAHGSRYDYSLVNYIGDTVPITIICKVHGSFDQTSYSHKSGHGCMSCGNQSKAFNTEEFIESAVKVHGERYDYSEAEYERNKIPVKIICKKHGAFFILPKSHKDGVGCPSCSVTGFKADLPAILYYLRVEHNGKTAYKIGITNLSVNKRYNNVDLAKITVLFTKQYSIGADALAEEKRILKQYKEYQYIGEDLLVRHGNTELFNIDIRGNS